MGGRNLGPYRERSPGNRNFFFFFKLFFLYKI